MNRALSPGGLLTRRWADPGAITMLLMPDGVPSCLIRAFSEERHLQSFLSGDVLIRRLDAFRSIEDLSRRDGAEGEARLVVPGEAGVDVYYGGSFHNPVYLLCCSDPGVDTIVDTMTTNLGAWWATISDPEGLLSALSLAAATAAPAREVIDTLLLQVRYTKASKISATPDSEERYRLMLAQKPQHFAAEREWRYAVVLSGAVPDSVPELWLRVEDMKRYSCPRPPA